MGSNFLEFSFIQIIAVSYSEAPFSRESKALYFDHQSCLVCFVLLLLQFLPAPTSIYFTTCNTTHQRYCLVVFCLFYCPRTLCVFKEESYFRFNDFYVRFTYAFVACCLQEEKANFIRANVGRLYLFGWMFLQMLSTFLSSMMFPEIPGYWQLQFHDLLSAIL